MEEVVAPTAVAEERSFCGGGRGGERRGAQPHAGPRRRSLRPQQKGAGRHQGNRLCGGSTTERAATRGTLCRSSLMFGDPSTSKSTCRAASIIIAPLPAK